MQTLGTRVALVREENKWSQTELADRIRRLNRAFKTKQSTIQSIEADKVQRPRILRELGIVLDVSEKWLLTAQGPRERELGDIMEIPVFGYAGGRERVEVIVEDEDRPIDSVRPPLARDGFVAVIVRGSSMLPAYREGDHLFFRKDDAPVSESNLNRDCIVLTDRDRCYVKRVIPGKTKGTFDLLSYDPTIDPIRDVKLKHAWRVQWVKRS